MTRLFRTCRNRIKQQRHLIPLKTLSHILIVNAKLLHQMVIYFCYKMLLKKVAKVVKKNHKKKPSETNKTMNKLSELSIDINPKQIFSELNDENVKSTYKIISKLIQNGAVNMANTTVNIDHIFIKLVEDHDIIFDDKQKKQIKSIWSTHKSLGKVTGRNKYKITSKWFDYLKSLKSDKVIENKNETKQLEIINNLSEKYKIHKQILEHKSLNNLLNIQNLCKQKQIEDKSWKWNMFEEFSIELQINCIDNWKNEYTIDDNKLRNMNDKSLSIEILNNQSCFDNEEKEENIIQSGNKNGNRNRKRKRKREFVISDDENEPLQQNHPKRRKLMKEVEDVESEYQKEYENEYPKEYENEINEYENEINEYETQSEDDSSSYSITCPQCSESIENPSFSD
eukprot:521394_1